MIKQIRKSVQKKQRILEECQALGLAETARKYGLSAQSLRNWQEIYNISGLEGLKFGSENVSPELKRLQLENQRL